MSAAIVSVTTAFTPEQLSTCFMLGIDPLTQPATERSGGDVELVHLTDEGRVWFVTVTPDGAAYRESQPHSTTTWTTHDLVHLDDYGHVWQERTPQP